MKTIKLLIAFLTFTAFCGCTKDNDPAEQPIAITMKNISGRYNITSMEKLNGGTKIFKGYCPTKNDILVVLPYFKVFIEKYDSTCGGWNEYSVSNGFNIESNGVISQNGNGSAHFKGKITELTATKFRLVFDEPTYIDNHLSDVGGNNLYTGILYTRIP